HHRVLVCTRCARIPPALHCPSFSLAASHPRVAHPPPYSSQIGSAPSFVVPAVQLCT
ncbi:hypothetical protein C8R44DRAFT_795424, partial [Mycena epipterygia]